jgi:hypothetical protein
MADGSLMVDADGEHEVFYFPPVKKEMMPERDRAMSLITNMGGKVSKKYDLGVVELAPPGTKPIRPGLTFFDWTWVFDCHGEGAFVLLRHSSVPADPCAQHEAAERLLLRVALQVCGRTERPTQCGYPNPAPSARAVSGCRSPWMMTKR